MRGLLAALNMNKSVGLIAITIGVSRSAFCLILAALMSIGTPVSASTILFNATNGTTTLAFTADQSPIPQGSTGDYFYISPLGATYNGSIASPLIQFWTVPGDYSGGFSSYDMSFNLSGYGTQLFSGPVSHPTFLLGTFALDSSVTATISEVSGVPEPATWAMMLIGFVGIGFAMRRRRVTALQTA